MAGCPRRFRLNWVRNIRARRFIMLHSSPVMRTLFSTATALALFPAFDPSCSVAAETNPFTSSATAPDEPLSLWYRHPATQWVEALPIGNGRLGAMVFGGLAEERIQFNESTLWIGEPRDYSHEDAAKFLPEIRRLLFDGKQKEAEQLAMRVFMSEPLRQFLYQPFADLRLQFPGHEGAREYRRELNLDQAVARTSYQVGEVRFERDVFASAPDQVIVLRIAADKPGQVSFSVRFDCPHAKSSIKASSQNEIALS